MKSIRERVDDLRVFAGLSDPPPDHPQHLLAGYLPVLLCCVGTWMAASSRFRDWTESIAGGVLLAIGIALFVVRARRRR